MDSGNCNQSPRLRRAPEGVVWKSCPCACPCPEQGCSAPEPWFSLFKSTQGRCAIGRIDDKGFVLKEGEPPLVMNDHSRLRNKERGKTYAESERGNPGCGAHRGGGDRSGPGARERGPAFAGGLSHGPYIPGGKVFLCEYGGKFLQLLQVWRSGGCGRPGSARAGPGL